MYFKILIFILLYHEHVLGNSIYILTEAKNHSSKCLHKWIPTRVQSNDCSTYVSIFPVPQHLPKSRIYQCHCLHGNLARCPLPTSWLGATKATGRRLTLNMFSIETFSFLRMDGNGCEKVKSATNYRLPCDLAQRVQACLSSQFPNVWIHTWEEINQHMINIGLVGACSFEKKKKTYRIFFPHIHRYSQSNWVVAAPNTCLKAH